MNKRLEKLARECGAWNQVYDQERFMVDSNFDVAKFAELIVKECSQFVEDKFDFCGDEIIIAEKIKEHFGVEE